MKEILAGIARYNASAMEAMAAVVDAAPRELRSRDAGLYFKSIEGTIEHMAWALALWLKRFAGFGNYACLASSPIVTRPMEELREEARGNPAKARELLRTAGELLVTFVERLPEEDLSRRVRYTATDGRELEKTLWHAIFQVLNHGTHHRGEISAILDANGVANDYNSFVSYVD